MAPSAVATHRLAGFRPADLDDVPAGRLPPEVMVEGHDTVNLGARQVQCLGKNRQCAFRDEPDLLLQVMEYF